MAEIDLQRQIDKLKRDLSFYTTQEAYALGGGQFINVSSYGASPSASAAANTAAIQAAIDGCREWRAWIPKQSSYYEIDQVYQAAQQYHRRQQRSAHQEHRFERSCWLGGASGFWDNVFSAGNYGGETDATYGALWVLTYYGIAAATRGDRSVTLDTSGEDSNFTAGDVVIIKSGDTFSTAVSGNSIPKYVMVNKVDSVSSGVISLVYPLNHDFDASSSIATDAETFTGLDGETSYIARNVHIRNMTLEAAHANNWSAMHISAIESTFENLEIIVATKSGIGANPNAFNKYRNITIKGLADEALAAFEMVAPIQ